MKHLIDGLHLVATRKDSRYIMIATTIMFMLLFLALQNGRVALEIFDFTWLSFTRRLSLFMSLFFNIKIGFTTGTLVLTVLCSLLGGINLTLAYVYLKVRSEMIMKSGLYSATRLFFVFLGIGCAACSAAFLSIIIGFFGFGMMIDHRGQEITYMGLIFLCMVTYTLAKKVTGLNVC